MAKKTGGGHGGASSERWLVSYADFITLLTVLFIVLYSFAKADIEKYKILGLSARKAFNIPVMEGRDPTSIGGTGAALGTAPVDDLTVVEKSIADLAQAIGMTENISIGPTREGLAISLSGNLIFSPGSADVTPQGRLVLDRIGGIVAESQGQVRVEGHTDNVPPLRNPLYASNWDLSGARAQSVLQFLTDVKHIDQARLSYAAFGEFRPVADNATREGRERNRRVDIILLRPDDLLRPPLVERGPARPEGAVPAKPGADGPRAGQEPAGSQG